MNKLLLLFCALILSPVSMANNSACSDAVGFWMGTYHIKDVENSCPEGYGIACQRGASVAIALKKAVDDNHYTAELLPQFGRGGTLNLYCSEGNIEVIDDKIPPEFLPKISLKCDDMKNCTVHYDDVNEQASLSRQWVWESYVE